MNAAVDSKGFTLLELLVYVTITGGLLVAVSMFFNTVIESRIKAQSIMEVEQQGALVMDYIGGVVRGADSITSPAAGGTGVNTITLAMPASSTVATVVIEKNGTVVQVREDAGAAIPLTNSKVEVDSLTMRNLTRSGTPGIVQISLVLSRVNTTGRNEYDYTQTFTTSVTLK